MTAMEPEQGEVQVSNAARERAVLVAYWASVEGGKPADLSKERCVNVFGNCFRVTCYTHKPNDYERPTHCAWIVTDDAGMILKIDHSKTKSRITDPHKRGTKW